MKLGMWAVSLLDCLAHQKSYFCGKREEKKDGKGIFYKRNYT